MKEQSESVVKTHSFVDFHIHILPGMDDGAKTVSDSLAMLRLSAQQNIRRLIATPHFYPAAETPDDFLRRRDRAVTELLRADMQEDVTLYVGAEVAYYQGIGISDQVSKLCISGTSYILVEMPFERWTDTVLSDLFSMRRKLGLTPIVAHIERYLPMQEKNIVPILNEENVLIQTNAEHLEKRAVAKLFRRGLVHLIGSDAHNLTDRVPNIAPAIRAMGPKTESYLWDEMEIRTNQILRTAVPVFPA